MYQSRDFSQSVTAIVRWSSLIMRPPLGPPRAPDRRRQNTLWAGRQSRNAGSSVAVDRGDHGIADQLDRGRRVTMRRQRDLRESQVRELQEAPDAPLEPPAVGGQGQVLDQALRNGRRWGPRLAAPEDRAQHLRLLGRELARFRLAEADRGRDVADVVEAKGELA